MQISEDVETDAESAGGKSCVVREEETGRLLAAYQAARLVHLDSPQYGIEDTTTSQVRTCLNPTVSCPCRHTFI